MKALHLTQPALAERAGISQVMVHKLLKGANTTKIVQLAKALECDPVWLSGGPVAAEPRLERHNTAGLAKSFEEALLLMAEPDLKASIEAAFSQLSPADKRRVIQSLVEKLD